MKTEEIQQIYAYNYWANDRILSTAAKADWQDLTKPVGLSWSSVLGTLVHGLNAEWSWRVRCQEKRSPQKRLVVDDFPTLAALRAHWDTEREAMLEYVASLSEDDLAGDVEYQNTRGETFSHPLWSILYHVVNHGTQHRGEVAHFLTQWGHSPGDLDFSVRLRSR